MKILLRRLATVLALCLLCAVLLGTAVRAAPPLPEGGGRAHLLMEATTGTVLYAQNERARLAPASVTKIMTLLLAMEALESGKLKAGDMLTVSAAAAGMGGSQVYMKQGERFSVHETLKCIAVCSANDACVLLAEGLSGSEQAFVARMNERAAALGMSDTVFKNCTGLPAEGHLTSARDIGLMSRALFAHRGILDYTCIWTDTIREGAFGLTNTNRLLKSYSGACGLKTGHTAEAGFCMSAVAERDGMQLIAVVLGAESSEARFSAAAALLDYGFAGWRMAELEPELAPLRVDMGEQLTVMPAAQDGLRPVVRAEDLSSVTLSVECEQPVPAPVARGQVLGHLVWREGERIVLTTPLVARQEVKRVGFGRLLVRMWLSFCGTSA